MEPNRRSPLERLQRVAALVAVVSGLLGLATSVGCLALPPLASGWVWVLHPALLLLGLGGGWATVLRGREIDRRRWEIVEDPQLTRGEREYAHREAERQRRLAGTAYLAAAVFLGYWLAYHLGGGHGWVPAILLAVSPLVAYAAGLLLAHAVTRDRPPR